MIVVVLKEADGMIEHDAFWLVGDAVSYNDAACSSEDIFKGSVTVKTLPLLTWLLTVIEPPMRFTY